MTSPQISKTHYSQESEGFQIKEQKGKSTKRTGLLNVPDKTEADGEVPRGGEVAIPERGTQVHRIAEPGAAPEHAPAAVAPTGF